jgi:hypothetical protein
MFPKRTALFIIAKQSMDIERWNVANTHRETQNNKTG